MGKNRSKITKILNELQADDDYDYDDVRDIYDGYDDYDEYGLHMILYTWFRLWRRLKAPLTQDDYETMEWNAITSLWDKY